MDNVVIIRPATFTSPWCFPGTHFMRSRPGSSGQLYFLIRPADVLKFGDVFIWNIQTTYARLLKWNMVWYSVACTKWMVHGIQWGNQSYLHIEVRGQKGIRCIKHLIKMVLSRISDTCARYLRRCYESMAKDETNARWHHLERMETKANCESFHPMLLKAAVRIQ